MKLVQYLMRGGHMAMFSDFSLKALIPNWSEEVLGPNPFIKLPNEFGGNAQIKFDPVTLKHSPSLQLQSVGALSAGGNCKVHCLGGTIVYTLNKSVTSNGAYLLEVITIANNIPASEEQKIVTKVGSGTAGHILLSYPSGGKLLTSMTHWSELVKIDVTEENLMTMALRLYGPNEVDFIQIELNKLETRQEQLNYMKQRAADYIKNSAPCNNRSLKGKLAKK